MYRLAGRRKTVTLPANFCENPWFFVAADAMKAKGFSATFWDGHVRAFGFFGGVPGRITYDNSKITISKIIGARL